MKKVNLLKVSAVILSAALAGCDRGPSFAQLEAQERQSRLYSNAMDDLQAGRVNAAIRGFEKVVVQEPKAYSAHFQLATLLQDVKRDYLGAIAHYRLYLLLRPETDKATIAKERMKRSEELLRAESVRKIGGNVNEKIVEENKKLVEENAKLNARIISIEGDLREANTKVSQLTLDVDKKRQLIEKLTSQDGDGKPRTMDYEGAVAEVKAQRAERRRRMLNPTDKELLEEGDFEESSERGKKPADFKSYRKDLEEDDDGRSKKSIGSSQEVKDLRKLFEEEDSGSQPYKKTTAANSSKSANPFNFGAKEKPSNEQKRPETYTVQEGDTLFNISEKFYGTGSKWHTIREANRATITPAGHLKPGQVIKLP